MKDIIFAVLQITVIISVFAITKNVIPYLAQKIKDTNYEWVLNIVKQAVEMAEQTMTGSGKGKDKKTLVTKYIKSVLNDLKIEMSDDQIDILIESAVYAMNQAKKE